MTSQNHPEEASVRIPAGDVALQGDLATVSAAAGVVLFAHGSGSGRFSPRNRSVAHSLQEGGLATLLVDLLTPAEEAADRETGHFRFDIRRLAERLVAAIDWLRADSRTGNLRIGLFGASTGAGAALVAAAQRAEVVAAVVSRGGRPDLAGPALARVTAPVLLIVGSRDEPVIALNEEAFAQLPREKRLEIIRGATHLFEEPGALEQVAALARSWFLRYLPAQARAYPSHPGRRGQTRPRR